VLADVIKNTGMQIAMSQHGEREIKSLGFEPMYAPHGIDTKVFRPKPEARKAFRDELGFTDENFVIGSVGLNYADDRKGFIPLMQAFKEFHRQNPHARLYLHSFANDRGARQNFINYANIACRHLEIGEWVFWPPQDQYVMNRIDADWLADIYNGFDVFCLPTKGEGFGIPLIEAASCGIPVITTNTTTGKELCWDLKTGWMIQVDDDDLRWLPNGCFRYEAKASKIREAIEGAHSFWKVSNWNVMKEQARKGVLCYDWDVVYPKYWKPVFKEMERRLRLRKKAEREIKKIKKDNPDKKVKVVHA